MRDLDIYLIGISVLTFLIQAALAYFFLLR